MESVIEKEKLEKYLKETFRKLVDSGIQRAAAEATVEEARNRFYADVPASVFEGWIEEALEKQDRTGAAMFRTYKRLRLMELVKASEKKRGKKKR